MVGMAPRLDHVVIDVRERLSEAASLYRRLGFHMTERSTHTMGSSNHLAVFESDYLELLGLDDKAAKARPEIAGYPIGLNGLVFLADDPDALFRELKAEGVAALEPTSFSRPVPLPGGSEDAKFRTLRLVPGTAPFGRVYFCHHFTPQLVWRKEWRAHPNGAKEIASVTIAVADPRASQRFLAQLFAPKLETSAANGVRLKAGTAVVELVTLAELRARFGDAAPDPAGRKEYMAALAFRTGDLAKAKATLAKGGIEMSERRDRILVPARAAMNATLEFVA